MTEVYHPGEFLLESIEYLDISLQEFAKKIDIPLNLLFLILSCEANITPEIAVKLHKILGTSEQYWLNLQFVYDEYKKLNKEN